VFNSGDVDDVSLVVKAHAIVANAQPELRRFNARETPSPRCAGILPFLETLHCGKLEGLSPFS
jgi:hypothetical protein